MKIFKTYFALSFLLGASFDAHCGNEVDPIGIEWARCSKEAKLIASFSKSPKVQKTLRDAGALLLVYSVTASGEESVFEEVARVERDFAFGLHNSISEKKGRQYIRSWLVQAELSLEKCRISLEKNMDKYSDRLKLNP